MTSHKELKDRTSLLEHTSSQLPKAQFFSSSASTTSSSCSSSSTTKLKHTHSPPKRSHPPSIKHEGRWFPTPKPRYNSSGKKPKQGSSYPYPRGENRLPFIRKERDEHDVEAEAEGSMLVKECAMNYEIDSLCEEEECIALEKEVRGKDEEAEAGEDAKMRDVPDRIEDLEDDFAWSSLRIDRPRRESTVSPLENVM
ncbi:hypothetical protein VTL71DRAFT_2283 [Oculimacula yallundae]|uniref:Uncharacterized protein n=1 Tax=Oculimacula yallundae TaxID=86028 RepID=A0ABR4C9M8_9HELO